MKINYHYNINQFKWKCMLYCKMSNVRSRARKTWSITEALSLQREYELLGLSFEEIADRHKRSVSAIISRLETEDYYIHAIGANEDTTMKPDVVNVKNASTFETFSNRMKNIETDLEKVHVTISQIKNVLQAIGEFMETMQ